MMGQFQVGAINYADVDPHDPIKAAGPTPEPPA
jgi:hypothetical protein